MRVLHACTHAFEPSHCFPLAVAASHGTRRVIYEVHSSHSDNICLAEGVVKERGRETDNFVRGAHSEECVPRTCLFARVAISKLILQFSPLPPSDFRGRIVSLTRTKGRALRRDGTSEKFKYGIPERVRDLVSARRQRANMRACAFD